MSPRSKILAAVLGLVVASGAIADASAKTVVTTHRAVAHRTVGMTSTRLVRVTKHVRIVRRAPGRLTIVKRVAPRVGVVVRPLHRVAVGPRFVAGARFVHRAPVRVKIVKHVSKTMTSQVVHVRKGPVQHHAMGHRLVAKTGSKTVIR